MIGGDEGNEYKQYRNLSYGRDNLFAMPSVVKLTSVAGKGR